MESTFSPEKYEFRYLDGLDDETNELIKQTEIDYLTAYFTYTLDESGHRVFAGNTADISALLNLYKDCKIFQTVLDNCNKRPNTKLIGKAGMNSNIFRVFEMSENQGTPKVLDRWLVTIQTTRGMIDEVNKIIEKKLSTGKTVFLPLLENVSERKIVSLSESRSDPKIMLRYPKHAAIIGGIAATFGTIDNILEEIFSIAAFGAINRGGGHILSPLAAPILKRKSIREKRNLISEIMKLSYSEPANEMISQIFKHLDQTAEHRNAIIHSTWHESSHFEDVLFAEAKGGYYEYPIEEFQRIYDYSVYVRSNLWDFRIWLFTVPRISTIERNY